MGIFRDEENAELKAPVLGMEPTHEIRLGLGHIEGKAVGFGKKSDQENQGGNGLYEDQPGRLGLRGHDSREAKGGKSRARLAHPEEDRKEGQAHRKLVGDHLGGRTDPPEERVLAVGGPASKDDPINTKRRHGQNEENTHLQVGQDQGGTLTVVMEELSEGKDRHCS